MWWRKNVSQKYWWCYFNFYAHALYIKTFLLSICWRRPHLSLLHHLTDDTYKQTKKWANLFQETIAFCVTEVFSIRIQTNKFSFFFQILSNYKLLQQEKKKLQLLCDLLNIWTKEITDCFSQYNERKYLIIQNHNGDSWRTTSATVNCTSTYLNKMVESHVIKWKNNILGIYKDSKNIHGMKINFVFFFFVILFFTFYCFPLFFLFIFYFFVEIYIYTCPTSSKQQRL